MKLFLFLTFFRQQFQQLLFRQLVAHVGALYQRVGKAAMVRTGS